MDDRPARGHTPHIGGGAGPDTLPRLIDRTRVSRPGRSIVVEHGIEANGPNVGRGGSPYAGEARCRSTLNARPDHGRWWCGGRVSARRWNEGRKKDRYQSGERAELHSFTI